MRADPTRFVLAARAARGAAPSHRVLLGGTPRGRPGNCGGIYWEGLRAREGSFRRHPLHVACPFAASEDVIEYLARWPSPHVAIHLGSGTEVAREIAREDEEVVHGPALHREGENQE